jgi:glutamate N-acetyltransferase/amino-acid N-acetyltransferase
MVLLLASGASGISPIQPGTVEASRFAEGLETVCVALARMMARDGEGATRLVEVVVEGAANEQDARRMARSVVSSSLVKAAIYGRDPNWGRIVAAVGNAGVDLDPDAIDVYIGDTQVAANGAYAPHDPAAVSEAMGADEVKIRVVLHAGQAQATAWGCDLTENYVKINAEYTT